MVAFTFNLSTMEAETGGVQQILNLKGAVFLIHPYGCVPWQCAVKGKKGDRERGWACGLEYMTSYFPTTSSYLSVVLEQDLLLS